jgi:hypothetical protein
MTAPIDSASSSTPTRSALDDYRPHPASHAAQMEAGRRYYREGDEVWRYAIHAPGNKPRSKPNAIGEARVDNATSPKPPTQ